MHDEINALRSLQAESAVQADLARLKIDAAHRAAVREILWNRAEEYPRFGYRRRPWLKALEIIQGLDETHPLDQSKGDQLIAVYASDRIEHARQIADRDPNSWWHSEPLWREFCARQFWNPEENL